MKRKKEQRRRTRSFSGHQELRAQRSVSSCLQEKPAVRLDGGGVCYIAVGETPAHRIASILCYITYSSTVFAHGRSSFGETLAVFPQIARANCQDVASTTFDSEAVAKPDRQARSLTGGLPGPLVRFLQART